MTVGFIYYCGGLPDYSICIAEYPHHGKIVLARPPHSADEGPIARTVPTKSAQRVGVADVAVVRRCIVEWNSQNPDERLPYLYERKLQRRKKGEFAIAIETANALLDRANADPDADDMIIARQFLRLIETTAVVLGDAANARITACALTVEHYGDSSNDASRAREEVEYSMRQLTQFVEG